MKKPILTICLFAIMTLCAHAYDFMVGGLCYNKNGDGATVTVTYHHLYFTTYDGTPSYSSLSGPLSIPTTVVYDGCTYLVTAIGEYAFRGCDGLTSLAIPNSVTSIGREAFYDCTHLKSLTIPNSVTSIGVYAFQDCTGLTSVHFGNSLANIGEYAFWGCSGLTSLTIPKSVTNIAYKAFLECSGLTSIVVEDGNRKYDSRDNCNAIIEKQSNTLILGCKNTIIPTSVNKIGQAAFQNCTGLTSIYIPNLVTTIDEHAFYKCSGLTSINIPKSMSNIGKSAFKSCTGLTRIDAYPDPAKVTLGSTVFNEVPKAGTLHVPAEYLSAYQAAEQWSEFTNVAGDLSAKFQVNGLWYDKNSDGTSVTVTYENDTFEGYDGTASYTSLAGELTIPSTVTYEGTTYTVTAIGKSAFQKCKELTSVTIPNSVTVIGSSAFSECYGLTSVVIPNSVTTIGSSAFNLCQSLESIDIPNSVMLIGNAAFRDCHGLTSVTISNSLTAINDEVFYGCTGLTSVDIPNSVISIGTSAFQKCRSLTSVTIPNSVTAIGIGAFLDCTGLTSMDIPNSVTEIGNSAFSSCTGLKSLTIPNSVTRIDYWAFQYCNGLTRIDAYPDPAKVHLGANVFQLVPKNGTLHVQSKYLAAYQSADQWNQFTNIAGDLTGEGADDDTFVVGGVCYRKNSGGTTVTVTYENESSPSYTSLSGAVEIPSTVNYDGTTYMVTAIGNNAFRECTALTSVTIPASIASIGDGAFSGCSGLTRIDAFPAPSKVTLGNNVFYGVPKNGTLHVLADYLEGYQTANQWNEFINIAGDLAYVNNFKVDGVCYTKNSDGTTVTVTYENETNPRYTSLSGDLTIPSTVTYGGATYTVTAISDNAFRECRDLTSVAISNTVKQIGKSAFRECSGLTSVILPETLTAISNYTFINCSSLTSITIPNTVEVIGDQAFYGCSSLASVNIPDLVTVINEAMFYKCSSLTNITIPNSVTEIGDYAFYKSGLISVTIPNSVEYIYISAFQNCSNLKRITIPSSVIGIGETAFYGCGNLTRINAFPNPANVELGGYIFDGVPKEGTLHVLPRYLENYRTASQWKDFTDIAGDLTEDYEDISFMLGGLYYFNNSESATVAVTYAPSNASLSGALTIPATVTYNGTTYTVTAIDNAAFHDCTGLTNVTIPNSVTTIGTEAFIGCTGLTGVNISNSVTTIGERAFKGCTSMTSVNIPQSVTTIGTEAFLDCTGLTGVNISNSVTIIGERTFKGCTGLTSVTIPNSVTTIGTEAFLDCIGLTGVNISNSVTTIGERAFKGCTSMTSVNIPNSLTAISKELFSGCTGLTTVTVPDWVTEVGNGAFSGCTGLTSVTISNSVTAINDEVFRNCKSLTVVNIPNSVTAIGNSAFRDCTGLTSITIPDSVTTIGECAFSGCSGLTSLTILQSLTSISSNAFQGCSGLTSIVVENGNRKYDSRDNCNAIIETESNTLILGCMNTTILKSVTIIGDFAFAGCSGLTSVNIPNSVTSIGGSAFSGCSGLTRVTIPNSVTSIGGSAFSGCSGLTSVNIPHSVTVINDGVFSGCKSLTTMTIPNSVTSIGRLAFSSCYGLKRVNIPNSVTVIGSFAFSECYGLTRVNIPDSVMAIGDYAFFYCTSLTRIDAYPDPTKFLLGGYRWTVTSVFRYVPKDGTLHVLPEYLEAYQTTDGWKEFTNIVADLNDAVGIKGDLDGSGIVDVDDVNAIINLILNYEQYKDMYPGNADLDGSGIVDVDDVNSIINIILGINDVDDVDDNIDEGYNEICSFTNIDGKNVALERKIDLESVRYNLDGSAFYRTTLAIKINSKRYVLTDNVYTDSIPGLWQSPCMVVDRNSQVLRVFSSSKTDVRNYGMEGFVYQFDMGSCTTTAETVFNNANWGWYSYFLSFSSLRHFSFAGYIAIESFLVDGGDNGTWWDYMEVEYISPDAASELCSQRPKCLVLN